MTIAEQMSGELQAEAAMTRRLLSRISPDKLGFSPGGGLHTVGWNAAHLAEIVGWVPDTLERDGIDFAEVDEDPGKAPEDDLDAILARFDANLAKSLASLGGVADATMAEPWTARMNGHDLFTSPKGDVLRKWLFVHTGHHRGILSATLRLAGVEHGSIYEE